MRNSSSQESEIFYYRNDPIAAADKTARAMGLDLPSKVLLKSKIVFYWLSCNSKVKLLLTNNYLYLLVSRSHLRNIPTTM